ncbi:MAG: hypothetical protein WBA88_19830 [Pseudaminobacter sp.]
MKMSHLDAAILMSLVGLVVIAVSVGFLFGPAWATLIIGVFTFFVGVLGVKP